MRFDLTIILFAVFLVAQLFCTRKVAHKIIKFIPMLICVIGGVLAIGGMFTQYQFLATLLLIPTGISLLGSVVGYLLGKILK